MHQDEMLAHLCGEQDFVLSGVLFHRDAIKCTHIKAELCLQKLRPSSIQFLAWTALCSSCKVLMLIGELMFQIDTCLVRMQSQLLCQLKQTGRLNIIRWD